MLDHRDANFWSRNRNPLTSNSSLPLVCCLKISGGLDILWRSPDGLLDLRTNCTAASASASWSLPDQSLRVTRIHLPFDSKQQPSDWRLLNRSSQRNRDPAMHPMPLNHLKWWVGLCNASCGSIWATKLRRLNSDGSYSKPHQTSPPKTSISP